MSDSIFNDYHIAAAIQWPAPAKSLHELTKAIGALHGGHVLTLRQALVQLNLMDEATLDALHQERPDLLRNRSAELVNRFHVSADDLNHAMARMAGLPDVDAENFEVASDAFDVVSLAAARAHDVVPLGRIADRFFVASSFPTNEGLENYLCFLTGHRVHLVWASRSSIEARLGKQGAPAGQRAGVALSSGAAPVSGASAAAQASEDEPSLENVVSQALGEVNARQGIEESASASDSAGVVRLVRIMIKDARESGASDIHIETNAGDRPVRVRMRREGQLQTYLELPAKLRSAVVSRIKVMARLDISERRRPQDGKIQLSEFGGGKLELRVAVLPTTNGLEDVVLRLLESQKPLQLKQIGLHERDVTAALRMSGRTNGLILAAGPTGAGKTTTLHSLLAEINVDSRKLWTAEDPVEITQPGLRQVQINPKIGLTFAAAMRSFLRADPDVIMIGEIRDDETAKIAIEASLTGHLVLSTLHTNNAAESVVRLLDLGISPFHFADSLVGIVAQRLVRLLCRQCSVPRSLGPGQFDRLVAAYVEQSPLSVEEGRQRLLEAAGVARPEDVVVRTAKGCEACNGSGYRGRIGVYEVLESNPAIRSLIQAKARPTEIFDTAVLAGMRSLRHDALEKMVSGRIDLQQAKSAYL
jgi:type II secretory ATPase GspE/PulE/Tfp pilus assembly ATPase PilB-like protein